MNPAIWRKFRQPLCDLINLPGLLITAQLPGCVQEALVLFGIGMRFRSLAHGQPPVHEGMIAAELIYGDLSYVDTSGCPALLGRRA